MANPGLQLLAIPMSFKGLQGMLLLEFQHERVCNKEAYSTN